MHGVLLDEAFFCQVAEVFVEENMHLLHRGVGIAFLHPIVEDGFQVGGGDIPHDFLSD